jgi:hypothetical protein
MSRNIWLSQHALYRKDSQRDSQRSSEVGLLLAACGRLHMSQHEHVYIVYRLLIVLLPCTPAGGVWPAAPVWSRQRQHGERSGCQGAWAAHYSCAGAEWHLKRQQHSVQRQHHRWAAP